MNDGVAVAQLQKEVVHCDPGGVHREIDRAQHSGTAQHKDGGDPFRLLRKVQAALAAGAGGQCAANGVFAALVFLQRADAVKFLLRGLILAIFAGENLRRGLFQQIFVVERGLSLMPGARLTVVIFHGRPPLPADRSVSACEEPGKRCRARCPA